MLQQKYVDVVQGLTKSYAHLLNHSVNDNIIQINE